MSKDDRRFDAILVHIREARKKFLRKHTKEELHGWSGDAWAEAVSEITMSFKDLKEVSVLGNYIAVVTIFIMSLEFNDIVV